VENWLQTIEFELTVYIKLRMNESVEQFIEDFWVDHSFLADESHQPEYVYYKLTKQIAACLKDDSYNGSINDLKKLFQPKFKKRDRALKKYSYVEFMQREDEKKMRRKQFNPAPMTFLCNKNKFSTLELSRRKFKIIDYGNCYDYSDERYGLINTRQYRAPEVILSESN
jgi:hypothetical protein